MSRLRAELRRIVWHNAKLETAIALVLAAVVARIIVVAAQSEIILSGRLAVFGVVVFSIGFAAGSPTAIALSTAPVLGAALSVSAAADDPAWTRSILIGCLWYLAVEVGWDAIGRRKELRRVGQPGRRRIHEVATVLTLSVGMSTMAALLADTAPERTLILQGGLVLSILSALVLAVDRALNADKTADAGDPSALP